MDKQKNVGGTKRSIVNIVKFIFMGMVFLLYMIPFILIMLNSFKYKRDIIKNPFSFLAEKGFTLDNYAEAFDKMNFFRSFGNSLLITGLSTTFVVLLAAMTAYYFIRANNLFSKIC